MLQTIVLVSVIIVLGVWQAWLYSSLSTEIFCMYM